MEYTIRDIPEELDRAAREVAKRDGMTLSQLLMRALRREVGTESEPTIERDLSDIAGQCSIDDDTRAFFAEQRQVDPDAWE